MIISRTPFRISFFGGGTDYPVWYRENKGSVISASINKFCFVTLRYLPQFFEYKYCLRYFKREEKNYIEEIDHPSIRECLKYLNIQDGVEIVHHADLPAQSGLGSSSTFTVSMLHSLYALSHKMPTKYMLASDAIKIEQDFIGEAVGSQDQTAAAFGGLNRIDFGGQREINVIPIILDPKVLKSFEDHLALFFTGFSRSAESIAKEQIRLTSQKSKELKNMSELVENAQEFLINNKLKDFGYLLNEQWKLKKSMSNIITNSRIDEIYNKGLGAGALGGKLLGAGGGGFMLFFIDPERRETFIKSLDNYLHVPFKFDFSGSQIIYNSPESI